MVGHGNDESGRSTIELPLDQTRYGAGIDANSTDDLLVGHTFESHPHELQQEGILKPLFGLMEKFYVMDGWWTDVRWANKTKSDSASGDGATLNLKTEGIQVAPRPHCLDDPTYTKASSLINWNETWSVRVLFLSRWCYDATASSMVCFNPKLE